MIEVDNLEQVPEVHEIKKRLSSLFSFRKAIFEEARVTDAPESRITSVLSSDSSESDSFVAVPKLNNPFLPLSDPEPVKASKPRATSAAAAERKLSLSDAKSKTAALLANHDLGVEVNKLAPGEYSFVVKTSRLTEMLQDLEECAVLRAVSYSLDGKCIFDSEVLYKQSRALQEVGASFPSVVEDIPLIKILNELFSLVNVAQRDPLDPLELDIGLQLFSTLLQVADIPKKIKSEMLAQLEIFQRFHFLSQFEAIVDEATSLFRKKLFERQLFDEFLSKLDPLIRAIGEEDCIPTEKFAVIKSVRLARELCWLTELNVISEHPDVIIELESLSKNVENLGACVAAWLSVLLHSNSISGPSGAVKKVL